MRYYIANFQFADEDTLFIGLFAGRKPSDKDRLYAFYCIDDKTWTNTSFVNKQGMHVPIKDKVYLTTITSREGIKAHHIKAHHFASWLSDNGYDVEFYRSILFYDYSTRQAVYQQSKAGHYASREAFDETPFPWVNTHINDEKKRESYKATEADKLKGWQDRKKQLFGEDDPMKFLKDILDDTGTYMVAIDPEEITAFMEDGKRKIKSPLGEEEFNTYFDKLSAIHNGFPVRPLENCRVEVYTDCNEGVEVYMFTPLDGRKKYIQIRRQPKE